MEVCGECPMFLKELQDIYIYIYKERPNITFCVSFFHYCDASFQIPSKAIRAAGLLLGNNCEEISQNYTRETKSASVLAWNMIY
jgi:hypothetical protein